MARLSRAAEKTVELVPTWHGRLLQAARAPDGALHFVDFRDQLLDVDDDPGSPLRRRLKPADLPDDWSQPLRELMTSQLGHYCELQSAECPDALTWSFVGLIRKGGPDVRAQFLDWLLERVGLPADGGGCDIELWGRVAGSSPDDPDGSLDVDFLLEGDRWAVIGEATWRGVAREQGHGSFRDRLARRRHTVERIARDVGEHRRLLVLHVMEDVPGDAVVPTDGPEAVTRLLAWDDLTAFPGHPLHEQLPAYLGWKRRLASRA